MTEKYEAPKWIGNLAFLLFFLFAAALTTGLIYFLFRWLYHLTA